MAAGHKPIVLMGDMSDIDLSRDNLDPVIRKWAEDFQDLSALADEGGLTRMDFGFDPSVENHINLVLFGRFGEEENMMAIKDLYEWEDNGRQGPPPSDKDIGEYLGYTEQDVKAWNLVNTLSSAARYAPFLIPAINDYMLQHNVPNRDAHVAHMLANPTEHQFDIPKAGM